MRRTAEIPDEARLTVSPEAQLVRDDKFIKKVIALARGRNLPVELSGSSLGHAFYQFQQARLRVYESDPYGQYERIRQRKIFDKLVRDEIPDKISKAGENVVRARLVREQARIALGGKLIEEWLEFARAKDGAHQKEELADLLEIIRGLARNVGVEFSEIVQLAETKRQQRGGFEEGTFLVETSLPKTYSEKTTREISNTETEGRELGAIRVKGRSIIFPYIRVAKPQRRSSAVVSLGIANLEVSVNLTSSGLLIESRLVSQTRGDPSNQLELPLSKK